jgi:predicted  nucleic acid-binding Zn-ribbon protein
VAFFLEDHQMNKQRRADIEKALEQIDEAKSALETARDEEQDYYDNLPDNFKEGDRGQQAEAAVSCLDDAINALEEVGSLDDALA